MSKSAGQRNLERVQQEQIDIVGSFNQALNPGKPWDNITDFALHKSFCGIKLYPRQLTILKLIYLEVENMTPYDLEVIDEWRHAFANPNSPMGIQPDIWERVKYLKSHGYTHFPHIQSVMGRRASKGMIGGILGAERMAHLVSLDNPQQYYGVAEGKDIYFCHDDKTEVLTEKGWRLFKDVEAGEKVGQVDEETGLLSFAIPKEIVDLPYDGEMISFKNGNVHDFAVTPNHSMVTYRREGSPGGLVGRGRWSGAYRTPECSIETCECKEKPSRDTRKRKHCPQCMNWFEIAQNIIDVKRCPDCRKKPRYKVCEKFERTLSKDLVEGHFIPRVVWGETDKIEKLSGLTWTDPSGDLPPVSKEDFMEFVGFWIGDGTKSPLVKGRKVEITQTRQDGIKHLANLLERLKWEYKISADQEAWSVYSSGLRSYLSQLGDKSQNVRLPDGFLTMDKGSRIALLHGLMGSDGSRFVDKPRFYHTTSERLAGEVQALGISLGYGSIIDSREYEVISNPGVFGIIHKVGFAHKNRLTKVKESGRQNFQYKGRVYCFTMPQGTLVTRRNKAVLVSGNSVVATSRTQAKKFQFADLRETVEGNAYLSKFISTSSEDRISLMTANDKRRIAELHGKKIAGQREIASIQAVAMSSTSASGRGGTGFMNFFDEFAHMITGTGGPRSSDEVYEAYQPSLDQFGIDAMTYVPSSPFSKIGKFYSLYTEGKALVPTYVPEDGRMTLAEEHSARLDADPEETFNDLTANPEMLILQLASWMPYVDAERSEELVGYSKPTIIQVSPEGNGPRNRKQAQLKKSNPAKFKVEREAQFAEVIDGYLDPDYVDDMFKPFWDNRVLKQQEQGNLGFIYTAHADPARTQCNFSYAIGHVEKSPVPDEYGNYWNHVIIDKTHVWNPKDYPRHALDYTKIAKEFESLMGNFRSLETLSFDAWNSAMLINRLTAYARERNFQIHVREEPWSRKDNEQRAEFFKMALYQGWVHAAPDKLFNDGEGCLLSEELKFLTEKNGVVEKQGSGPVQTKDLADSVMAITTRLLSRQILDFKASLNEPIRTGAQGGFPQIARGIGASQLESSVSNARSKLASLARRGTSYQYSLSPDQNRSGMNSRGGRWR